MRHVLLIGNLDGHSIPLLRYASKLCRDLKLRLHILKIEPNNDPLFLSSPYYVNKFGILANQAVSSKKKELEAFVLQNTKGLIDSSWIAFKLMRGNIEPTLNSFINEERIDLIIARQAIFKKYGIEENEIFKKIFLNIAEIPTLLIPENHSYEPIKKLAYFLTFKQDDYANIQWLSNNLPKSTHIDIIHFSINQDTVDQQKWIKYLMAEIGITNTFYLRKEEVLEDFIRKQVDTVDPDYNCLGLTTHRRNFWQRIIDPSTVLSLLTKIETPTLIFKYTSDEK